MTAQDVTPVSQADSEVRPVRQARVTVVEVGLQLQLPTEGLPALGAGPEVDPVVQLGQLHLAEDVSQGVEGTLVGQPHLGGELSDHGHEALQQSWLTKHLGDIWPHFTWWIILRATEESLESQRRVCWREEGGEGEGGTRTKRTSPATANTRQTVKPARHQTTLTTDILSSLSLQQPPQATTIVLLLCRLSFSNNSGQFTSVQVNNGFQSKHFLHPLFIYHLVVTIVHCDTVTLSLLL